MSDTKLMNFINNYHVTLVRFQGLWVAKSRGQIADGVSLRDALVSLRNKVRNDHA